MIVLVHFSEDSGLDELAVYFQITCVRAGGVDGLGWTIQCEDDFELFADFGLDVAFCSGWSCGDFVFFEDRFVVACTDGDCDVSKFWHFEEMEWKGGKIFPS